MIKFVLLFELFVFELLFRIMIFNEDFGRLVYSFPTCLVLLCVLLCIMLYGLSIPYEIYPRILDCTKFSHTSVTIGVTNFIHYYLSRLLTSFDLDFHERLRFP